MALATLQARFTGGQTLHVALLGPPPGAEDVLARWEGARLVAREAVGDGETRFTLASERADDLRPALFRLAVDQGWTLTELTRDRANLEDVFRQLTSG